MRSILLASLLLASPAFAAESATASTDMMAPVATARSAVKAAEVKARTVVWDKNGARVGPVISIIAKADGAVDFVTVIQGDKSVRIAGSTLSLVDSKLTTSLARREIGR